MSLEIDRALREGFDRTISRNGLLLVGVFLVFSLANLVVGQSLIRAAEPLLLEQFSGLPEEAAAQFESTLEQSRPFAIPMSYPVALGLTLVAAVVAEAIRIASIRVFAAEQQSTFPRARVTHRLVAATINGVVAGLLVAVIVGIGAIFLLLPGIYAALSLYFVRQEVAVENKNFLDAIRDSWALTGGSRWEVLGLAIILFVIGLIAGSPGAVLNVVDPVVGTVVSTAISAATTVFGIAVVTRAYEQLRRERAELMDPEFDGDDEF